MIEGREQSIEMSEERTCDAEEIASTKALRWEYTDCIWEIPGKCECLLGVIPERRSEGSLGPYRLLWGLYLLLWEGWKAQTEE